MKFKQKLKNKKTQKQKKKKKKPRSEIAPLIFTWPIDWSRQREKSSAGPSYLHCNCLLLREKKFIFNLLIYYFFVEHTGDFNCNAKTLLLRYSRQKEALLFVLPPMFQLTLYVCIYIFIVLRVSRRC
jgi:hypothetical protein